MAIAETVVLITTQTFMQGDARDPLGIWGARHLIVGDASGGSLKTTVQAPEDLRAAYVYTAYSATITTIVGSTNVEIKCRLLSNWPNIDPQAGVQAYATCNFGIMGGDSSFSPPLSGPRSDHPLVLPNDRFILLYDPRAGSVDVLAIMELELGINILNDQVSFEAWGYFWDRSVITTPGGPRHPGAN